VKKWKISGPLRGDFLTHAVVERWPELGDTVVDCVARPGTSPWATMNLWRRRTWNRQPTRTSDKRLRTASQMTSASWNHQRRRTSNYWGSEKDGNSDDQCQLEPPATKDLKPLRVWGRQARWPVPVGTTSDEEPQTTEGLRRTAIQMTTAGWNHQRRRTSNHWGSVDVSGAGVTTLVPSFTDTAETSNTRTIQLLPDIVLEAKLDLVCAVKNPPTHALT